MSLDQLIEGDTTLAAASPRPSVETIMELALAYLPSRALHLAATLGIADLLAGRTAGRSRNWPPKPRCTRLERLLRTLAMHGVFAETDDGR